MYVLIQDNQIAGSVDDPLSAPDNFKVVEYPDTVGLDSLTYKDGVLQMKPEKPSDKAYWDYQELIWVDPKPAKKKKDKTVFTKSDIFAQAKELAKTDMAVMVEFITALHAEAVNDEQLEKDSTKALKALLPAPVSPTAKKGA